MGKFLLKRNLVTISYFRIRNLGTLVTSVTVSTSEDLAQEVTCYLVPDIVPKS